jgi:hypothetical protein
MDYELAGTPEEIAGGFAAEHDQLIGVVVVCQPV